MNFFKPYLPRSLFGRSLLILVLPVVLIQVVTTAVFVDRHWEKVTGRLSHAVAGEIAVVAAMIEDDADGNGNGDIDEDMRSIFDYIAQHLDLQVSYDAGAQIDVENGPSSIALFEGLFIRTLKQRLEAQLERPFALDVDFADKRITIDVQLEGGVLEVVLPERRLFSSSGYVFLIWVFGSSILLLVVAVLFMRNQIRPIRKLAAAAKRFGQGRDVPNFKPQGAREVRDAAQSFVDMRRRIKRQVEQRTAMLAGVSHDLRTPLTRIKLQLEMFENSKDVEAMKRDIAQMQEMIDGYLDFVRGEGEEATVLTDLRVMLEDLLKQAAHSFSVQIDRDIPEELNVMIRPRAFERALMNIVQNAGKYATCVWVRAEVLEEEPRKLFIQIEDNGPGIPQEQYEEVFRPFYRLDEARNVDEGGVGLGLPIAMDVINGHGGKIWLEKSAHGGLCVNIRMPV